MTQQDKDLKHSGAELRARLDYFPSTGEFYWTPHPKNKKHLRGIRAGNLMTDGYRRIKIDGVTYKEHQLVFLIMIGGIPDTIDHIDRDRANNKLSNLRIVNKHQNCTNRSIQSRNSSGITGVSKNKDGWYSRISNKEGKRVTKWFSDFFEACCWRKSMENKLGYLT